MNFDNIKTGFIDYLKANNKLTDEELKNSNSSVNLYSHSAEFKKYVVEELKMDSSAYTMSIAEILKKSNEDKSVVLDEDFDENLDETQETPEEIQPNTENQVEVPQMITGLIDELLLDSTFKSSLDADGDGTINTEELNKFYETIKNFDSSGEDISLNDIMTSIDQMKAGTFELEGEDITPNEIEDEQMLVDNSALQDIAGMNGGSGVNGSYGGGGSSGGGGGGSNNVDNQDSGNKLEKMSLEELESEKATKEGELTTAQDDVNKVHSGENKAVQGAQEDLDSKKEAYENALENDENISEDLKNRQSENQQSIDESNAKIDELNININDTENKITEQNSIITADESNIEAIQNSIDNLEAQSTDDPELQADIDSKLSAAKTRLQEAQAKLEEDKATLTTLEGELQKLNTDLETEETTLSGLEDTKAEIEAEIAANCGEETKAALEAYKTAEETLKTTKETELQKAEAKVEEIQGEIDEIDALINTKNAKAISKEFSINSLDHPEQLYAAMGLEEAGLSFEVFEKTLEGYNNLEDKGNGFLGIFDTTQSRDNNRYYLLDLNTFELVGQCELKIGSGDTFFSDVQAANKGGSHATLSGFEMVGEEYYSSGMGKKALRLDGLEPGINDNSRAKGTVVHYTTHETTWGCKGFPPIYSNGKIDHDATYKYMHEMFPKGTILFTYPQDEDYWDLSNLY